MQIDEYKVHGKKVVIMNKREKELFKLGKKYQKWFENTAINADAYQLNSCSYYLAFYKSKLGGEVKATAVISTDSNYKKVDAMKAFTALVSYFITWNNVEDSIGERAKLNILIWKETRDYLRNIIEAGLSLNEKEVIYRRSLRIIESMIDLQYEMIDLWHEAKSMNDFVVKRGFFIDEEVEKVIEYVTLGGWIQYKQFQERYENREDFDVIFANRNDPNIKSFEQFSDPNTLKEMTSSASTQQLKQSMDRMTDGMDMSHMDKEAYCDYWIRTYKKRLDDRVENMKKQLRYP